MPQDHEEKVMLDKFSKQYLLGKSPIMLEIERVVCGCNYGATSWTTKAEAHLVSKLLALTPKKTMLEIGAGSGWPGLYLAKMTGCNVTLVDIPQSGLKIAKERINKDQLVRSCQVLAASGDLLPFAQASFDSLFHSDVLCCLSKKTDVLNSMRRVIRIDGTMVFSVISVSPGLSKTRHKRALNSAPLFVESSKPYPFLLLDCGWKVLYRKDITTEYYKSVELLLANEVKNKVLLEKLMGAEETRLTINYRQATRTGLKEGLIRRELFRVSPKI